VKKKGSLIRKDTQKKIPTWGKKEGRKAPTIKKGTYASHALRSKKKEKKKVDFQKKKGKKRRLGRETTPSLGTWGGEKGYCPSGCKLPGIGKETRPL